MGALAGRTALVTGASRGIGAAIARIFGLTGARVALVARTRPAIEAIAMEIGNGAVVVEADLRDVAGTQAAARAVLEAFGSPPDIVVNNAGVFDVVLAHEMEAEALSRMIDTNLLAPMVLLRELLPGMRARGSGHVVSIGSIADRATFAGNAGYSATKFAMRAVHQVVRDETRGTGVRATLVSPAGVNTGIWEPIRFPGAASPPDRSAMLDASAVAGAVLYAVTQPDAVNVDELRLSRA